MEKNLRENDNSNYLFVYGTLLSDVPNRLEHTLRNFSRLLGPAYAYGKLYDFGDYPGAVFNQTTHFKVFGELVLVLNDKLIEEIDNYEEFGPQWPEPNEYVRIKIPVNFISPDKTNQIIQAYTYHYNHPVLEMDHIVSGDYKHFLEYIKVD